MLSVVLPVFATMALIRTIIDRENNEETDLTKAYERSYKSFFSYLWVQVLFILSILGGLILLIIPAIIFGIWYAFSNFTFFAEGLKGRAALGKSHFLVKGRWWGVFGRLLLVGLIISIVLLPLSLLSLIPYFGQFVNLFSRSLSTIFMLVFTYFLYKGLKEIKKA